MATGESQTSLAFAYRISQPYIGEIITKVCDAIQKRMLYLIPHPRPEDFVAIEQEFYRKTNFPNVVGCLDGKHIRLHCPNNSGSLYFNYKDYFSIILFALADAKYKFIAIDVGSFGREGDAGKY